MLSLREFASKLERVKWSGDSRFVASCPAHEDQHQSLSVTSGNDGRILVKCHTGCTAEDVMRALGVTWREVLPERERPATASAPRERSWVIRDAAGNIQAEHIRIDEGTGKRFVWKRDGQSGLRGLNVADLLYRAEHVAKSQGPVYVCEGEKAADACARLGVAAVGTVCGASSTPSLTALASLAGRDVVLWPDNDKPGVEHMDRVSETLQRLKPPPSSIRWVQVPSLRAKGDAADFVGDAAELARYVKLGGALSMFVEHLDSAAAELDRLERGDFSRYVSTGVEDLDHVLGGGLRRGQTTLLGAPAGAGKTSLVVQFAMAAEKCGPVLVVSPEMSPEELVVREVVRRSGKPKWNRAPWIRSNDLRIEAAGAHIRALEDLRRNPPRVALFDAVTITLDSVLENARRLAKTHGRLSLIALDYAQQLAEEGLEKARYLAVGEVGLRAIEFAREFDCAVLVTSQVNVVRDGKDKRYVIRESSNLEQKANNVLLFIVERSESGEVTKAAVRATKVRDGALFALEVDWRPDVFQLKDKRHDDTVRDFRDWTDR